MHGHAAPTGYGVRVSFQNQTATPSAPGVSVEFSQDPATTVAGVSLADGTDAPSGGLRVGLMVLLMFAVTILAAVGDTVINGSITYITGAVFVVISVVCAALVRYDALSTAIITPPLAFFTAILVAGQLDILKGARDNLAIRESALVLSGLAFNAPWIFAGTGAAALIVIVRRFILHR